MRSLAPGFPMQLCWSTVTGRIGTRWYRSGWIQARPVGVAPVLVMVSIIVITPFRLAGVVVGETSHPVGAPACAGILSGPPSCRGRCGRQARSRSLNGVRLPAYTSRREKCEQSVSKRKSVSAHLCHESKMASSVSESAYVECPASTGFHRSTSSRPKRSALRVAREAIVALARSGMARAGSPGRLARRRSTPGSPKHGDGAKRGIACHLLAGTPGSGTASILLRSLR